MLKPCPECGNPCAEDAAACPKCGKEAPNPSIAKRIEGAGKSISSGCWGCLGLIILLVIVGAIFGGSNGGDTQTSRLSSDTANEPAPPPTPLLRMYHRDLRWTNEYGHVKAVGRVTNISGKKLDGVMAVVEFEAADGALITSADAMIDYQPLLPGQTSPFTVMETWNPAMVKGTARVSFKEIMGEEINTERR